MINPAAQRRCESDNGEIGCDTAKPYGQNVSHENQAGDQDIHPRRCTQAFWESSSGEKDRSKLIRPRIPSREKMAKEQIIRGPVQTRHELKHWRFDA